MQYVYLILLSLGSAYTLYLLRLFIFKYMYNEPLSSLLLIAQETFNRYKSHEFSALILAQNTLSASDLNEYRGKYIKGVLSSLSPAYKRWLTRYFLSSEGLVIFISSVFDSLVRKNNLMNDRSYSQKSETKEST